MIALPNGVRLFYYGCFRKLCCTLIRLCKGYINVHLSDFSGWYEILESASIFFVRCSFEEVIQRPAGIASQARPRSDIATCPVAAARNSRNFNSSFRGKIRLFVGVSDAQDVLVPTSPQDVAL